MCVISQSSFRLEVPSNWLFWVTKLKVNDSMKKFKYPDRIRYSAFYPEVSGH